MFDQIGEGHRIMQESAELRKEAKELAKLCNNPDPECCPAWHGVNKCPNPRKGCEKVTPEHWLEVLTREAENGQREA